MERKKSRRSRIQTQNRKIAIRKFAIKTRNGEEKKRNFFAETTGTAKRNRSQKITWVFGEAKRSWYVLEKVR